MAAYRHAPVGLRARISALLVERICRRARFVRTAAWSRPPERGEAFPPAQHAVPGDMTAGVNIFGYLRGQFGLAEAARAYAAALMGAGFPVALIDIDLGLPHGMEDTALDGRIGTAAPHSINLLFVNPDYLEQALQAIGPHRLEGKYMLACWFWELEKIPDDWHDAIECVDEIMVASRFIESAFRAVTDKPVLLAPLPLVEMSDSGLQRADFGMEDGKFTFLASFDFHSWIARKNPYAVIESFRMAFPLERDDVRLLIKSSNGHRHPQKLIALLRAVSADPRITLRDDIIAREHIQALQRCADAYVSLHRAEGFGLGMAESMALAKPIIATGWSGNLDFMDAGNSRLVDYRLVPVGADEYPRSPGAQWADADIESAATAMRYLADNPDAAAKLGQRAARDVARSLSAGMTAERVIRRLREIQRDMRPSSRATGQFPHEG